MGVSEGGIQTALSLPRLKLIFDIGRGASTLVDIPRILLTHGHLDHASGVAYHISQRSLRKMSGAHIFCPEELANPLDRILKTWQEVEEFEFQYTLTGVDLTERYPITGDYYFQGLNSYHRIPSIGYVILEKKVKLKKEFTSLPGHQIARMKKQRNDMFYESWVPLVVFSGDTRFEFIRDHEVIQKAKIVFMECTYIDDKRPVERAREWGHTHLYEIAKNAELFREVERLYLIHFSPRYRPEAIVEAIDRVLPSWLAAKTFAYL